MELKVKRNKPIIRQLEEKYGGKWGYIRDFPNGTWECEKKGLTAHYVANGGYDMNGNYVQPMISTMYVYGLENGPERFVPSQSYDKFFNKNK